MRKTNQLRQNACVHFLPQVTFSQESMKEFHSDEPVTFVTYEFFEHELQTTPVIKGSRSCTNTLSVIGSG